jgi:YVTN family beta-propeller protein
MAMNANKTQSAISILGLIAALGMLCFASGVYAQTIPVGSLPDAVAINPVTNTIYVANAGGTVTVIDGATNATITVVAGSGPDSIAVNGITNKIYVANNLAGTVTVIDGVTLTTATVVVGSSPDAVAINPVTNKIYVANAGSNNVTVIDGVTNITTTITAGSGPSAVAINPLTNKIYITNAGSSSVTVVDGITNATSTFVVGSNPNAVAVNSVTNRIYVANAGSGTVTVIDGTTNNTATITAGSGAKAVAVNPVTNKIYVANSSGTVTVIDGATNTTASISADSGAGAVAVNSATNRIYVANNNGTSGTLTMIDGATNATNTVGAGSGSDAVAVNPVTDKIYVANSGGTVNVFDGSTNVIDLAASGMQSRAVGVNPVTDKIYVANFGSNDVTEIDGLTNATATIAVGSQPVAIAVNPVTNNIYVANFAISGTVTVIDGATHNTSTVPVGVLPVAIAVNMVTNKIYVANEYGGNVTVIDGATNATISIVTGTGPEGVAVNPVTNTIYVANGDGTVTVIDGATNSTSTISAGTTPFGVAVNPITNRIYVSNIGTNDVTVIDGASNTVITTLAAGSQPRDVAINLITNKIYTGNIGDGSVTVIDGATSATNKIAAGGFPLAVDQVSNKIYVLFGGSVRVIDGLTNATTTLATAINVFFDLAVNPVTNKIYAANFIDEDVAIVTEAQTQSIPLVTAITPLVNNQTASPTPTFGFAVTSNYKPLAPVPLAVYFQVDTWQGTWTQAIGANASFSGTTAALTAGFHVLYAYASDGQDSGASGNGFNSQIAIGQIAAYPFVVMNGSAAVANVTVDASNLDFGSQGLQIPSQPMTVTVTSTGSAAVSFGVSTLTGANAGDFAIAADGCAGALLSNGGTCQVSVTFVPTVLGARAANLQINLNQPGAAPIVALTGLGASAPPKTPSTITLSISPNPSVVSQDVTLTAIVTASAGSPAGTVTFLDGSSPLGIAVLDSTQQATLDISSLTAGTHSITAIYSGDPSFTASASSTVIQSVTSTHIPTTTTLASSVNPATYAQTIILTATVSSTSTGMTGVVTFASGGTTLGQAQLSGGTASIAINAGAARTFGVTAVYGGDQIFATSTSAQIIQGVNQGATKCSISLVDADNPSATNPLPFDDANIDVLVSSQNTLGQITGTTNVFDNNVQLPQGFLSNASSVFGLSKFTPGSHTYLGVYSGDTNNTPAQCTFVFTLPKLGTVTTLASSLNPANAGQSVVFSANVSLSSGHAPTGSVTLSDSGTSLAVVPLDSQGAVSFSTSSLTAGPHSIKAIYGGDQSFNGSSSAVLTQTILASTGGGGGGGTGLCSCGMTGAYIDPAKAVDLDKTGDPPKSSKNKYSVTASIDNATQITSLIVTRASDQQVMFSSSTLPITTHWGFSPDEDRFLYHSVAPGTNIDEIIVLDLTATPVQEVVNFSSTSTSDRLQFSPSGSYFLFTDTVGQNMGEVKIFRISGVASQTLVHDDTYTFQTVPGDGEDSFGGVRWGFGPGKPEPSFVYAYGNGPTSFSLNLVNLATGHVIPGKTIAAISSFWQYNPCSDVLGVVTQPLVDKEEIGLYLTRDGSTLFSPSTFPIVGLTALSSDGTSEVVKFNFGAPVILAPSPSCGLNTPVGPNVVANPKDPATGQSPITVTFSNVTQSGQTSVTSSTTGTPPPAGFELGTPPVFYDVATTATFSGQITICISYAGIIFPNGTPQLFHFVNGAWVNQTITVDTNSKMICATVSSLSPFAIFESIQTALTVTANNASQVYGATRPAFGVSYSGFVNGDTAASLGGTLICASTATQSSPIGHYPITCSGQSSATYVINYVPGTLTIAPAPLTIAANSVSRPYGASNPVLTGIITGLQNGDPITGSFTTTAGPASLVGNYPIMSAVFDPSNRLGNYSLSLINGILMVAPEPTLLTVTLSPLSIVVGQSSLATVTLTAPDMVIPIDPSALATITLSSPVVSDIFTNNGACTPVPSAAPGVASCIFGVTSVEPNGRTLNAHFAGSADLAGSSATANLIATAALESQQSCLSSDFLNVSVPGGSYLWFNSILKLRDVSKHKITITFFQSSVRFHYKDASKNVIAVNLPMPDAKIVIDPSVTTVSTTFDTVDNVWITTIPFDLDDAAFLTGVPWLVPAGGIPADIEPVNWCGTFASDTAGVDIGWRWAAAAYSSFSGDNGVLGVRPMDTDHDNQGANHDLAGTPENFKQFVIPGARSRGAKNYTGTYSRSAIIE